MAHFTCSWLPWLFSRLPVRLRDSGPALGRGPLPPAGDRAGGGVLADARGGVGIVLIEGFPLQKRVREPVQPVPAAAQGGQRLRVAFLDDLAGFGVNQLFGGRGDAVQAVGRFLAGRGSTVTGPIAGDMPHRPAICRAMLLACSMSFSAPVVTSP